MKSNFFILFFLVLTIGSNAQPTTAQDWTKTDCTGNSHHLFSYLDSNHVAVMLFEMGCGGCADGGKALEGMKQYFDVSHPGKIHFFAMDYWVGHSCTTDVDSFVTTNNLSYPGLDHCLNEKNYYTSASPMPMIIVAAGAAHSLFYFSISYAPNDSVPVFKAIDSALAFMSLEIIENKTINSVQIFPNPTANEITLSFTLPSETSVKVEINNLLGERVMMVAHENYDAGIQTIKIDTKNISKGIHFVNVSAGTDSKCLKFIVN